MGILGRGADGRGRARDVEVRVLWAVFDGGSAEPGHLACLATRPGRSDHHGRGRITEEFFDCGRSRTLAWHLRPEAARLIEAVKDPNRSFDAIVIGSYERAFYGNQASLILPLLEKHGVQLWMPEVGGPVTSGHDELVALLGILAKRETIRARARTVGAMTALVRDYGRYVGGRPAYGYRLVAVGPHPKRQHAAWGGNCYASNPTPTPRPSSYGSSRCASTDTPSPGSYVP